MAQRTASNGHGRRRVRQQARQAYLVLRTLYISPQLDNRLRMIAEKNRKSKNEVMREMLAREADQAEAACAAG